MGASRLGGGRNKPDRTGIESYACACNSEGLDPAVKWSVGHLKIDKQLKPLATVSASARPACSRYLQAFVGLAVPVSPSMKMTGLESATARKRGVCTPRTREALHTNPRGSHLRKSLHETLHASSGR